MAHPPEHKSRDRQIQLGFLAALLLCLGWGYFSGGWRQLQSPPAGAAAQQRALDRLFGGDVVFDPNAADVMTAPEAASDSLSWKLLATAKLKDMAVSYPAPLRALAGHRLKITGYMFPLQGAEGQSHFLLSAYPPSCPYCLPAGPTELIDIQSEKDVAFTYSPITLDGVFQPLEDKDDLANGFIYRFTKADIVKK